MQEFHVSFPAGGRVSNRLSGLRQILIACLVLLSLFLSGCGQNDAETDVSRQDLRRAQNILADFRATELRLNPALAEFLDLETELPQTSRRTLGDYSQAAYERRRLLHLDLKERLINRPRLAARHPLAIELEIAAHNLAHMIRLEQTGRVRASTTQPDLYTLHPFDGIWRYGPALLIHKHSIDSQADAQAFLYRMASLADAIHDIRRRLRADAATDAAPPVHLLKAFLERLQTDDKRVAELKQILIVFSNLTETVPDLSSEKRQLMIGQADSLLNEAIHPAYQALIEEVQTQLGASPLHGGLWAQPQGAQIYSALIRFYDVHTLDPDHQLERTTYQVEDMHRQLQQTLNLAVSDGQAEDMASTLTSREKSRLQRALSAFYADPERDRLSAARRATELFQRAPRPSTFTGFSGIQDTRWSLPFANDVNTLNQQSVFPRPEKGSVRELIPMAASQQALALYKAAKPAPQSVSVQHMLLFETTLAQADLAMHHGAWSFEDVVTYLHETACIDQDTAHMAGLWLMTYPGVEAAKFHIWQQFEDLSQRAQAVTGEAYDETGFQTVLASGGPRPLSLIEADIEAWYADLLAGQL